ncbi:hypothetical protein HDV05_002056 [Chytridiales sp. JEL 0842]|nr:hypothetical protein HDV05_002056 [Chytridiales sp. JEL 0842]
MSEVLIKSHLMLVDEVSLLLELKTKEQARIINLLEKKLIELQSIKAEDDKKADQVKREWQQKVNETQRELEQTKETLYATQRKLKSNTMKYKRNIEELELQVCVTA